MKRFFLFIFVLFALVSISVNAQSSYLEQFIGKSFSQQVAKAWVETCALNRATYPDSNLVMPGNVIDLPLGKKYVAKPGGTDHMWQASNFFVNEVVTPFLLEEGPTTITSPATHNIAPVKKSNSDDTAYLLILALIIVILFLSVIYFFKRKIDKAEIEKRAKEAAEKEKAEKEKIAKAEAEAAKSFAKNPPAFNAPEGIVESLAIKMLKSVFGKTAEILGKIERGFAKGKMIMLNLDDSTSEIEFNNEEAWRAVVKLPNGKKKVVVSRWSCFNPIFGTKDGEFFGTFTPEDSRVPEDITPVLYGEIRAIVENKRLISNDLEPVFSEISTENKRKVTKEKKSDQEDKNNDTPNTNIMELTRLQISAEKGINIEGKFPMEIGDLQKIIGSVVVKKVN